MSEPRNICASAVATNGEPPGLLKQYGCGPVQFTADEGAISERHLQFEHFVNANGDRNVSSIPPFPPQYRAAGVLLHVTSLPTAYGIGDVGPVAMKWIDLLHAAGQSWWQSLPLGPTGYGNSPYQSLSSFAGNGLLVSPEWLIEDGLLSAGDCVPPKSSADAIDFKAVIPFKVGLLERAWSVFGATRRPELSSAFEQFCHEQAHWLDDYALFRALKIRHGNAYYINWPVALVERVPAALAKARSELANEIQEVCFAQFLLFRQGARIREYARENGIRLIGDLPFFVSPDSSDVWANPELFLLDQRRRPRFVAGVPPDYFSPDGQLWGNPLFDWDALRRTGYRWCIDRLRALLAHVDAIRLDHFRAFAAAWHIPADASTAQGGEWRPGPGADFFLAVQRELRSLPFIAEDLGYITPDVNTLRDGFHFPGIRVLQFAFDGHSDNLHLPHNYTPNTVVYTGTHDNPPTKAWYDELPSDQRDNMWRSLGSSPSDGQETVWELMRRAWSSVAALAIAPLQDVFNLGLEARMNIPGRADGNWAWRATAEMISEQTLHRLSDLTTSSNRRAIVEGPTVRGVRSVASRYCDQNPLFMSKIKGQIMNTPRFNEQQLQKINSQPGFIAALDQSGGSTPEALRLYGIKDDAWSNADEMFQLVHQMRSRIITSPSFSGDRILAAILFESTMDSNVEGQPTAHYLWNVRRVVPFLKVDKGLAPEKDGVQLMKPMPDLTALLDKARAKRIFGTKMRSVIKQANAEGISVVVNQQFEFAAQITDAGLVPIVEPEIDIHCPQKAKAEELLKAVVLKKLNNLPSGELVMLKLTLPEQDDFFADFVRHPNVVRVVALSGGYTRDEANEKLRRNHGVVASFSRALAEGLSAQQSDAQFNAVLNKSIESIFQASNN